jgi:outer membrane biosynthesis protein TonB
VKLDRAEWTGTGAALLFHVALIGAMSLSLAHVVSTPEPPSMEVDFVDEVGLTSASPEPPAPAPAAQSPTVEPVPEPDEPTVAPAPAPAPTPLATKPLPRPVPKTIQPAARPAPARPAPAKPAPRAPRLGDDFLKGIAESPSTSARAAPATVSASAMAGIQQAIRRQVQPCADRQVNPGPGASRIRVKMNLQLLPNGRLKRPPVVISTSGVDGDNEQYEERVKDLALAIVAGCAPFRGLPEELYRTSSGSGWNNFNLTYNLP